MKSFLRRYPLVIFCSAVCTMFFTAVLMNFRQLTELQSEENIVPWGSSFHDLTLHRYANQLLIRRPDQTWLHHTPGGGSSIQKDKAVTVDSVKKSQRIVANEEDPHSQQRVVISTVKALRYIPDRVYPLVNETHDRILSQLQLVESVTVLRDLTILVLGGARKKFEWGSREFEKQGCPELRCQLSNRKKEGEKADVVLFAGFITKTAWTKPPHQIWVVSYSECARKTGKDLIHVVNQINFTATYRRDSTLVIPYEKFVLFPNVTHLPDQPMRNFAESKTKMIAWFVSNCNDSNGRLHYVHLLQSYITVDIYGRCGPLQCNRSDNRCMDMLSKDYKFYLSFENTNCGDYITEKLFWNGLWNDVVPVVMGAPKEDYEAVVPPHSIIHVDDFESPRHLAEYLHYLDRNDTAYNQYFRWKGTGEFINTKSWCRLCAMAHHAQTHPVWYEDVRTWWKEDVCVQKPHKHEYATWRDKPLPPLHGQLFKQG